MKIGVVSDSHDHVKLLRKALATFKERNVEVILHAGDFVAPFSAKLLADRELTGDRPVHCIFGNNDGEKDGLRKILPQLAYGPMRLQLGDRTIVMHHYLDWIAPEDRAGADIIISGHTHEIVTETRDGVFYLNPGECCGVLSEKATCAILNTAGPTAEIIELS